LAVYVRSIDRQLQFYTARGRWRVASQFEVSLTIDARIEPEFLAPLLPYFPSSSVEVAALPQFALEGGIPRDLGAPIMSMVLQFEGDARLWYCKHSHKLDNIYDVLAHAERSLTLTLDEIAKKAFDIEPEDLTEPQRCAIHRALHRHSSHVIENRTGLAVASYRIRPKAESRILEDVVQLVRKHQDTVANAAARPKADNLIRTQLGGFAARSRKLISRSRQSRVPTDSFCLGPQQPADKPLQENGACSKTPVEPFSREDKSFLHFLLLWALPPSDHRAGTLNTTGSMILRAIGMYDGYPLTPPTAYLFLQEVGILAPWDNIYTLSQQLELPGHGFANDADRLTEKGLSLSRELASEAPVDRMKDLRKDWGDLPVFCVDSASAAEIDDGISIEPVQGSPDTFWIRIHVANPSAFIPPEHELSRAAAHLFQSFYSPERVYPLFPSSITHEHFSLAPGRPTITISAKVNMAGDILDTEIANGRIHNVIYLSPQSVQKLFGVDHDHMSAVSLTVGGTMAEQTRPGLQSRVPDEHSDSFFTLEKLLGARQEQRRRNGAIEIQLPGTASPIVSAGGKELTPWSVGDWQAYRYDGDPVIQLSGRTQDPFRTVEPTKDDLVQYAMLLAGEVAAQWCKERNVPVIFSCSAFSPESSILGDSSGQRTDSLPRAFASSTPGPHAALGMDQYTKCTSPLRRYADLLAHWQIEASLRGDAELPFPETAVDKLVSRSGWLNKNRDWAQARSRNFWICQLLHRVMNFQEADLPETFQCVVVEASGGSAGADARGIQRRYSGSILPFRIRCLLETSDSNSEPYRVGDLIEVKLSSVNVYETIITAEPVRLVKRPESPPVGVHFL
jgi:hypothetical protein